MPKRNTTFFLLPLMSLCLGYQAAFAGTVYQWTDDAGNINFSDAPPDKSVMVETHEINISQNNENNIDMEQYSIINQVEKMAAWRKQLSEERLAKRMLNLEEKRLAHEIELQKDLDRQNNMNTVDGYIPRSYGYVPYQFSHRQQHRRNVHPHNRHGNPMVTTPSRRNRNIIPRKYGPVHL